MTSSKMSMSGSGAIVQTLGLHLCQENLQAGVRGLCSKLNKQILDPGREWKGVQRFCLIPTEASGIRYLCKAEASGSNSFALTTSAVDGFKRNHFRMNKILSCIAFSLLLFTSASSQESNEKLVVGVTPSPPFSYDEGGEWTGVSVELWKELAPELGFDYELKPLSLGEAIDGLESGEVYVVAAALVTTPEREEKMNFSHSFYSSGLSVATSVEKKSTVLQFLKALISIDALWALAALGILLFIVGAIVWVAERKKNPEQFGGSTARGLGSGFWWSAVTMTTVGYGDKAPVSFAGRIVGLIWMFASIILISGFTGAIASALTVSSLSPSIESFDDLYRSRVGALEGSSSAELLKNRGIRFQTFENTASGLQAVAEGKVDGFVNDAPVLSYYVSRDFPDQLYVLEDTFEPGFYALGLSNDFGKREDLNIQLLKFMQTAEWKNILQRHMGES